MSTRTRTGRSSHGLWTRSHDQLGSLAANFTADLGPLPFRAKVDERHDGGRRSNGVSGRRPNTLDEPVRPPTRLGASGQHQRAKIWAIRKSRRVQRCSASMHAPCAKPRWTVVAALDGVSAGSPGRWSSHRRRWSAVRRFDAAVLETADGGKQVRYRAAEAVHSPDHEHVAAAGAINQLVLCCTR